MTQGEMFSDLALEQQYDNMIKELGMEQETKEPLNQNKMNTEKQLTAVEFLIEQLEGDDAKIAMVIGLKKYNSIIKEAIEMEKEQISEARLNGFMISGEGYNGEYPFEGKDKNIISTEIDNEQYYNETFKSE